MRRRAADAAGGPLLDEGDEKPRLGAHWKRTVASGVLLTIGLLALTSGSASSSVSVAVVESRPLGTTIPPLGGEITRPVVVAHAPPPPSQVKTPMGSAAPPPAGPPPARVGLLMLVVGSHFPPWWPFLIASYGPNHPTYELIVVHTGDRPVGADAQKHVRYEHIALPVLRQRFIDKLGAAPARVEAKFESAKGLSDLKPFYGHVFDDLIGESAYTHWGWADWDLLIGDMRAVVPEAMLWEYDALTFPGATLGFAWAGQLSIFRNDVAGRTLFRVVSAHVELGFKTGAGEERQSGWEERVLLKWTLRSRPSMSILFHMAAQFDYKAQWLTWVPFDHYWHEGKIWRCARHPLDRVGRPPLVVTNVTRWLADVSMRLRVSQHEAEGVTA